MSNASTNYLASCPKCQHETPIPSGIKSLVMSCPKCGQDFSVDLTAVAAAPAAPLSGGATPKTAPEESLEISGGCWLAYFLIGLVVAIWFGVQHPPDLVDSWGTWFVSSGLLLIVGLFLIGGILGIALDLRQQKRSFACHVLTLTGLVVGMTLILAPTVIGLHGFVVRTKEDAQSANRSSTRTSAPASSATATAPAASGAANNVATRPATTPRQPTLQDQRTRAQAGDAQAQTELASQLISALPKDGSINNDREREMQSEARLWLDKAVAQNHPTALMLQGFCIGMGLLGYEPNPRLAFDLVMKNPHLERGSGYYLASIIHSRNYTALSSMGVNEHRLITRAAEHGHPAAVDMMLLSLAKPSRLSPRGKDPQQARELVENLLQKKLISPSEATAYRNKLASWERESEEVVRHLANEEEQERQKQAQAIAEAERVVRPMIDALKNFSFDTGKPPQPPESYSNSSSRRYRESAMRWTENHRDHLRYAGTFLRKLDADYNALPDKSRPVHQEYRETAEEFERNIKAGFDDISDVIDRYNRYLDNRDAAIEKQRFWNDFNDMVRQSLPRG